MEAKLLAMERRLAHLEHMILMEDSIEYWKQKASDEKAQLFAAGEALDAQQ